MTRIEDSAWYGTSADDLPSSFYAPDWLYTLGKVLVTVAAFAVLIVLAIGYVAWLPFRLAWSWAEHRPKSRTRRTVELAALGLAVAWIVNLWRPKPTPAEKAYREGYLEATKTAAKRSSAP